LTEGSSGEKNFFEIWFVVPGGLGEQWAGDFRSSSPAIGGALGTRSRMLSTCFQSTRAAREALLSRVSPSGNLSRERKRDEMIHGRALAPGEIVEFLEEGFKDVDGDSGGIRLRNHRILVFHSA
jgi:hypothetical protein